MIEGSVSTRPKNIRIRIRKTAYKCAELIDLDYNPVVQANLSGVCGGPRGERTSRGAGTQRGLFCQVGEQLGLRVGEHLGAQGRQQLGFRVGEQIGAQSRQQLGSG
jgi:hypothetical protein